MQILRAFFGMSVFLADLSFVMVSFPFFWRYASTDLEEALFTIIQMPANDIHFETENHCHFQQSLENLPNKWAFFFGISCSSRPKTIIYELVYIVSLLVFRCKWSCDTIPGTSQQSKWMDVVTLFQIYDSHTHYELGCRLCFHSLWLADGGHILFEIFV